MGLALGLNLTGIPISISGSGLPTLPPGFSFLVNEDGDNLINEDGQYLIADQ